MRTFARGKSWMKSVFLYHYHFYRKQSCLFIPPSRLRSFIPIYWMPYSTIASSCKWQTCLGNLYLVERCPLRWSCKNKELIEGGGSRAIFLAFQSSHEGALVCNVRGGTNLRALLMMIALFSSISVYFMMLWPIHNRDQTKSFPSRSWTFILLSKS